MRVAGRSGMPKREDSEFLSSTDPRESRPASTRGWSAGGAKPTTPCTVLATASRVAPAASASDCRVVAVLCACTHHRKPIGTNLSGSEIRW